MMKSADAISPVQGGGTGSTVWHGHTMRGAVPVHPTLPAPHHAAPWTGLCHVDGAPEDTKYPSGVCQNEPLLYFGGNQASLVKVTGVSFVWYR